MVEGTANKRISWYRTAVEKSELKSLTQRSDAKGLAHVLLHLLLAASTGTAAYYVWSRLGWYWSLPLIWVHGTVFSFLGEHAAIHELSHGTVFKSKGLNTFFIRLLAFMTWSNYLKYRASHMQHHQYTAYTGQDLEVELPYSIGPLDWFFALTIDFPWMRRTVGTIIRHSFGIIKGEWEERLFPETDPKARRELVNWARTVLAGQIIIAALLVYFSLWPMLVLFTFASCYATFIPALLGHPQHIGLKPSTPDFRLNCRSVKVSKLLLFLHWNMDYHIEHHMYAAVPFYNLPRLRSDIEHDLPKWRGVFGTWKEILFTLSKQKTDPDYYFVPALPEK